MGTLILNPKPQSQFWSVLRLKWLFPVGPPGPRASLGFRVSCPFSLRGRSAPLVRPGFLPPHLSFPQPSFAACQQTQGASLRQLPLPSPPSATPPCCPGPPPSTPFSGIHLHVMVHGVLLLSGRHADLPSPPPLLLLLALWVCVWARPSPLFIPRLSACVRVLCHAQGGARAYLPATLLHAWSCLVSRRRR